MLTFISIPNSVTEIGDYAFEECSSLTNITISNSATKIGECVFSGCPSLTNITNSNCVTKIGSDAFPSNCNGDIITTNFNVHSMEDYEKTERIGQGNQGIVWKCIRKSDRKIFAIKEIPYQEEKLQQCINEIKTLSQFRSKFIVKYVEHFIDCVYEKKYLNIVMEFCESGDLSTYIDKMKKNNTHIEEKKIWRFLVKISCGLNECHSKNIIHRDIKPENIFLFSGDNFKLGDFGFAREIKDQDASTLVGTPYNIAPEVVERKNYNEKCDIWGLGCTVYEMATFHPPFESKEGIFDLLHKIQNDDIKRNDFPYSDNLFNLVKSMLEKEPSKRPSIKEILEISIYNL